MTFFGVNMQTMMRATAGITKTAAACRAASCVRDISPSVDSSFHRQSIQDSISHRLDAATGQRRWRRADPPGGAFCCARGVPFLN
jgi:hypothetical protein